MKLEVLGAGGGVSHGIDSTSMLVNGDILLDAGTGARRLRAAQTANLRAILLTHAHMDHVSMIPFIADIKLESGGIDVFGPAATIRSLRRGIFNDELWPNFEKIKIGGRPMMRMRALKPYLPVDFPGLDFVTPLPVKHAVPTMSFYLRGAKSDFLFVSDFWRASPAFWAFVRRQRRLRRMTIEVSFPDRMAEIAAASMHMTAARLAETMDKIPPAVEIFCTHLKPGCETAIRREIAAVARAKKRAIGFLKPGMTFEF